MTRTNPKGSRARTARTLFLALLAPLTFLILAACAGEFETVGEALRLVQRGLPDAVVNEPYEETINAVGGLRPYTFEVDSGSPPPGITLQNGVLRGTPTELGRYEFSIAVSDGNLNRTVQEFRLAVTEVPPPRFTLAPPLTEVRGAVTLRARVEGARQLQAARVAVTWDPEQFVLREGSVTAGGRDLAFMTDSGAGRLQVDLTALGRTLDGEHTLFSFVLEPLVEPASLWLDRQVEFLHQSPDPARAHHYLRQTEGRRPATSPNRDGGFGTDEPGRDEPGRDEPGLDDPGRADPESGGETGPGFDGAPGEDPTNPPGDPDLGTGRGSVRGLEVAA